MFGCARLAPEQSERTRQRSNLFKGDTFGMTDESEYGGVAEWSNAADSKSVIGFIPIGGSNPPLSANYHKKIYSSQTATVI